MLLGGGIMQLKLLERRREMIKELNLGASHHEVVTALSSKYGVTPQALYNDYRRRKTWLPFILEIDDPKTYYYEWLAKHQALYRMCSLEFLKAEGNIRVSWAHVLRALINDQFDLVSVHDLIQRLEVLENKQ
jgi:hypothetical protein